MDWSAASSNWSTFCDRRTCGQAGRGPGHRCGQPHSPGTLSLLSPSGYYFSSMYHFAMNTSNWIWKPRVRPRRVRMQPWLLRRRWREADHNDRCGRHAGLTAATG
jgi:hypothetical protein